MPVVGIGLVSLINWISAWQERLIPYYITNPCHCQDCFCSWLLRVPITPARLPILLGLVFSLLGDIS